MKGCGEGRGDLGCLVATGFPFRVSTCEYREKAGAKTMKLLSGHLDRRQSNP